MKSILLLIAKHVLYSVFITIMLFEIIYYKLSMVTFAVFTCIFFIIIHITIQNLNWDAIQVHA